MPTATASDPKLSCTVYAQIVHEELVLVILPSLISMVNMIPRRTAIDGTTSTGGTTNINDSASSGSRQGECVAR